MCSIKIPIIQHATLTNLLVFHRFVEQNEYYRAAAPKGTKPTQDAVTDAEIYDDVESPEDWKLAFGPITESELMTGVAVKERLVKLLGHSKLANHLLKERNLLPWLVRVKP